MNPYSWLVSTSTIEGEYQGHKMRVFPATCKRCEATTVFPAHATHWDRRHREAQTECLGPVVVEQGPGSASIQIGADHPEDMPVSEAAPQEPESYLEMPGPTEDSIKEATVNKGKKITSHKQYEARKDEILAAYESSGRKIYSAAKALGIPETTLRGLVTEWTKPQVEPRSLDISDVVSEIERLAQEHEDAARVLREAAKLVEA